MWHIFLIVLCELVLYQQEDYFEMDKWECRIWREIFLKPKNICNIENRYYLYQFTIFLHFKFLGFNLELFGAEQVSAIYHNKQTVLLFLNNDVYNIYSLVTHFLEFILLFCLEYFKDRFDTQFQSNCTIMQCSQAKEGQWLHLLSCCLKDHIFPYFLLV